MRKKPLVIMTLITSVAISLSTILPHNTKNSFTLAGNTTTNTDAQYAAPEYSISQINKGLITTIRDDGTCGITNSKNNYIQYEAYAGLKVHCHGNTRIDYTMYSHSSLYTDADVYFYRGHDVNTEINLGSIKIDETKTIDIKDMIAKLPATDNVTGLYCFKVALGKNRDWPALQDIYYDGTVVKACRSVEGQWTDVSNWTKVVSNLDPKDCLDMYVGKPSVPITYPTSGLDGKCNHVDEWCAISDKLIINENWSDEIKVFACVTYLMDNIAYDNYRVETLKNSSRATEAQCWTDDSLWTLGNNVGQCWDCANIMTIMLRHNGIPCTTVENKSHTVNAVWLRNEWVAIDVSAMLRYHCDTKDYSRENWIESPLVKYMTYYGYYDTSMNTRNQALATPETTLAYTSGKNPM